MLSITGSHRLHFWLKYDEAKVNPINPALPGTPDRQLGYYVDPNQLMFSNDVSQWATLLLRLEANTPNRAPGGLPAAITGATPSAGEPVNQKAFTSPSQVTPRHTAYLPVIYR